MAMLDIKFGSRQICLYIVFLALTVGVSACAGNRMVERKSDQSRVVSPDAPGLAVVPFENLSEYPNAGQIMTRLMSTELYRQARFRVRQETVPAQWLGKTGGAERQESEAGRAQQLGHIFGVDAVLMGSVTEYRYQNGLREEPVVGLSARVVRSCDGRVVWASSQNGAGHGLLRRESLNQVAQRVVQALAAQLEQLEAGQLNCSTAGSDATTPQAESENGAAPEGDAS